MNDGSMTFSASATLPGSWLWSILTTPASCAARSNRTNVTAGWSPSTCKSARRDCGSNIFDLYVPCCTTRAGAGTASSAYSPTTRNLLCDHFPSFPRKA